MEAKGVIISATIKEFQAFPDGREGGGESCNSSVVRAPREVAVRLTECMPRSLVF